MLKHYLLLSLKVLARRKFFTFISIFGTSFTLLVLMVVTAIIDHRLAPMPPETRQDRMLIAQMAGMFTEDGHGMWCCAPGFLLFDRYARDLPGIEQLSLYTATSGVDSYRNGNKITSTMKRTDGEILVNGSGRLARTLIEHDLVDEVRLMVYPFVLGEGERLFPATAEARGMCLVESRTVGTGLALLSYRCGPSAS